MDSEKLRATLRDPLLLNYVSMMFALNRTYALMESQTLNAWGHGLVTLIYALGFLAAFRGRAILSYRAFWSGSGVLAICVALDILEVIYLKLTTGAV